MAANGIPTSRDQACLTGADFFAVDYADGTNSIEVGGDRLSLSEFLASCGESLAAATDMRNTLYSREFYRARNRFVQAGLQALAALESSGGGDWLQIGIRPSSSPSRRGEFCLQVADVAKRLLKDGAVENFFYMNKPPGMRLRFEPVRGNSAELRNVLDSLTISWLAEGLIDLIEGGVYEPESQLFGGPLSMDFVHPLFTVDSLMWLEYHACAAVRGEELTPAWLLSLAMLRIFFTGLDIAGWEDIGVWDNVRQKGRRLLGQDEMVMPTYAEIAGEIRAIWSRGDLLKEVLDPTARAIVADHEKALLAGAACWRSGYFSKRAANLGPRSAAAMYVIFHWNRGALSILDQALLAESLSQRGP